MRLIPLVPFWLLNLAPALVGIPLAPFAGATFIGIMPATFVFASIGAGVGAVLAASNRNIADLVTPGAAAAHRLHRLSLPAGRLAALGGRHA